MTPTEKVAYIKGLMEGMELDTSKGEGKILAAVVDALEDLALGQGDLQDSIEELNEGLDAVSDDLELVEDLVYSEDDEDDECCCGHHHHDGDEDDEYEYEVECPACGATLVLDETDLDQGVIECPECGETLELELTEDEDDDDDDDYEEYDDEDLEPEE